MLKSVFCVSLALGAATLVGCKDDETKAPAPPAVTPPAMPATPATQPSADVPAVPAIPAVPAAPAVTPPAVPAADAVDPEAKSLMDQVKDAIKNKKWDDASAALKKLEGMKDKLPASWQDELKSLQAAVDAGKLTGGLPGFGK